MLCRIALDAFYSEKFVNALEKLDKPVREAAAKRILRILELPLLGKQLHGEANLFSERFMQYRIVYKVEGETIIFVKLGKRDNVYRAL